jgi:hypothetical protein
LSEASTADEGTAGPSQRGLAAIAIATMTVAVVGLLAPIPMVGRAAYAIGDLAHAPLFAGLTLGILYLLDRLRPVGKLGISAAIRLALVFAGFFAFGIAIELLQARTGRNAALHDVMGNGSGILAATLWYWSRNLQKYQPDQHLLRRLLLASAGVVIAVAWWSPLASLRDTAAVYWQFPRLGSFESSAELERWYFDRCDGKLTRKDATDGSFALEISYQNVSQPAATLYRMQTDWSQMSTLELDAVLDAAYSGDNVQLMVKVVDQLHADGHSDTFRKQWTLWPGRRQQISIDRQEIVRGPDTRQMDLSQMEYLHLVLLDPIEMTKVRVDRVRLTLR